MSGDSWPRHLVKQRLVALALIAATQLAWTSQLRSDAEIRTILTERLKGFEQSVGSVVKPQRRTAVTLAPEFLDKYAGRYRFSENEIWTMRRDRTRFFITRPGEPEFEVFAEGDFAKGNDDFFSKSADALFTFDFAKDDPRLAKTL